ncbi:MAG: DUF3300 domain-containing protein [Bryobacteraceae bacterium]
MATKLLQCKLGTAVACALLLLPMAPGVFAQGPPPPQDQQQLPPQEQQQQPPQQLLAPDQLDSLVAPVALYPDSLLSQVLVACTYPLEVVEAGQWLQQNRNLSGQALVEAARQQNWDPSVQALVAFPDVVARLNQDIRWTTDIGNAFLAQEGDVMSAVQRMRARAQSNGKLTSNPQETVTTQTQGSQTAIEIQPANPQVIYVPVYNPAYIWGPPVYGPYPPLYYPGIGIGFTFGRGISIGAYFGGWGGGWGGWGWGPSWFNRTVIVNNYFLHRYRYNDYHGGDFRGTSVWAHDAGHRLGVPYANRQLDNHYRGAGERFGGNRGAAVQSTAPANRGYADFRNRGNAGGNVQAAVPSQRPAMQGQGERFGSRGFPAANPTRNQSAFGGIQDGARTRVQSDHGYASMAPQRSFHGSSPAAAPRVSAQHESGGGRRGR